jgi:hypothetical protein
LAAVVDRHPDAEGQGGLALGDIVVADPVGAVGGDAEAGVEPVEGLLGGANDLPGVAVSQLAGQVGVVDVVQGGQVAADADGELVDGLAGEVVATAAGRGLQMDRQLGLAVVVVVAVVAGWWRLGLGRV